MFFLTITTIDPYIYDYTFEDINSCKEEHKKRSLSGLQLVIMIYIKKLKGISTFANNMINWRQYMCEIGCIDYG
jgi:hypothetical protein